MADPRIVSLIASSTEILCALGFESHLVGRSHECDTPDSILRLPICTEARIDAQRPSAAIDRSVRDMLRQALSVYVVDPEQLRALQPDVIVTQVQCEVCAVSVRDVELGLQEWVGKRPRLVSLAAADLNGVWGDIQRVAEALDAASVGATVVQELRGRIEAITRRSAPLPRRRVACVEWIEPLMASGNWMPELVQRAGGDDLFGINGKHTPYLDWAALCAADPEYLFVLPCGFDLARTRQEMPALLHRPRWADLQAVRNGRVILCDGNAFFNRPGPRLVESLQILAEVLHPDTFDFGMEGEGWQRLA
jgi:iron complex transport system substrate-binding protein